MLNSCHPSSFQLSKFCVTINATITLCEHVVELVDLQNHCNHYLIHSGNQPQF